jgi:hypothetical protein
VWVWVLSFCVLLPLCVCLSSHHALENICAAPLLAQRVLQRPVPLAAGPATQWQQWQQQCGLPVAPGAITMWCGAVRLTCAGLLWCGVVLSCTLACAGRN